METQNKPCFGNSNSKYIEITNPIAKEILKENLRIWFYQQLKCKFLNPLGSKYEENRVLIINKNEFFEILKIKIENTERISEVEIILNECLNCLKRQGIIFYKYNNITNNYEIQVLSTMGYGEFLQSNFIDLIAK